MIRVALLLLFCASAFAQTFDVASVKISEPPGKGRVFYGMTGGPGTDDPGRITFSHATMTLLLTVAYGRESSRIEGPDWFPMDMFDISAKVPAGTNKEQMPIMLQNLLAERFGMKAHLENKEMPSYILTAGKKGPKLKASVHTSESSPQGARVGFLPGKATLSCNRCTMAMLADRLGATDATGLTGLYDFTLVYEPVFSNKPGMDGPPPPPAGNAEGVSPLESAIQEQLGLKLETKKSMVEVVVVDSINRKPTEN